MESPLSAREFLKRFHLPQLVRIHHVDKLAGPNNSSQGCQGAEESSPRQRTSLSPGHSNTSISSSFIAIDNSTSGLHTNVTSEWDYVGLRNINGATNESLPALARDDHLGDVRAFRSLSAWSSVQVDRMLQKSARDHQISEEHRLVRVPRASLIGQTPASSNKQQQANRKSVDFVAPSRTSPKVVQVNEQLKKSKSQLDHPLKLVPPSKSSTLSKLELNQPFLLYKAHKKIELCAYAVDEKNQLNEKSGDPIYFPHNYQGKCASKKLEQRHIR